MIDKVLEPAEKYCKDNDFETNENGVYIYRSVNGLSSINLPCILIDYVQHYLEIKQIYTKDEFDQNYQLGYEEGCEEGCEFTKNSLNEDYDIDDFEYAFSVKSLKVQNLYDEMKFNIIQKMYESMSLEQLEKLSDIQNNYDKLKEKYDDLYDSANELKTYAEYNDDYDYPKLHDLINSLRTY